jgi:cytochrome c oxidase subunit 2
VIYQNLIFAIALTGMGLVAIGFIYIVVQVGRPLDPAGLERSSSRTKMARKVLFAALIGLFVGLTWATLHRFPIPQQNEPLAAAQIVDVTGRQWSWQLSLQGQPSGSPLQLQAGSPVEFRVTSADVNHGFAIYAPDGRIAIQTQAMPGFTNKILYTFATPGTYTVMCLEYCGLGHAPMTTAFDVVAPTGG